MESGKKLRRRDDGNAISIGSLVSYEIRISDKDANDQMRMAGFKKIWNSYRPDEFERIFVDYGLIPIGYYYSTFDVETNELVFLAQDHRPVKLIIRIRHRINSWFVKRGW